MTLTATERQFLHIAKVAVSGGKVTAESVDWPAVFTLAGQQKLLPIVFEAVRKTPAAAENAALFAAVKQQVIAQVLNQTVRSAEFADLYHKLRAAGLRPIVVKGQLCSRLYPLKDHRISADDDLYIPDAEFMACHEQLLANGLTTDTPADEFATADEVSYTKSDSPLYIELHRHLFDSAEDAHDELNRFFADIPATEIDGLLTMPPHEHLLYLLLHAYKHFVRSGIGLRQFCDIGLWAQAYHSEIDWQRLRLHQAGQGAHRADEAVRSDGLNSGKKENGRKGLLPSARCLPLHAHGLLLFCLLHGLFGAAAAVEEQQVPRVLIKIALAGLEHGDHVFLRLVLGVNLFQPLPQDGVNFFCIRQPDFNKLLIVPDVHLQIKPASFNILSFLIFPAAYARPPVLPPAKSPVARRPPCGAARPAPGAFR